TLLRRSFRRISRSDLPIPDGTARKAERLRRSGIRTDQQREHGPPSRHCKLLARADDAAHVVPRWRSRNETSHASPMRQIVAIAWAQPSTNGLASEPNPTTSRTQNAPCWLLRDNILQARRVLRDASRAIFRAVWFAAPRTAPPAAQLPLPSRAGGRSAPLA